MRKRPQDATLAEMDALWDAAKAAEGKPSTIFRAAGGSSCERKSRLIIEADKPEDL
jgi:hypothetical protein